LRLTATATALSIWFWLSSLNAVCQEKPIPALPSPTFKDIEGKVHRPFADSDVRAVVLTFTVIDCPIVNSYLAELNRIDTEYGPRGVRVILLQVDPALPVDEARKHARQYDLQPPVVFDEHHDWVRKVGAKVTPEVAVISPAGEVLYNGRIDDRFAGLGKRREQATSHDLRKALDAILSDRPVDRPRTKAVGCSIPELPKEQ
jgi:hypothetical protein